MDAIKMLKTRQSERSFLPYSIDLSVVEDIIDCARLSASARNVQPWHFIVVDDKALKEQIVQLVPNGKCILDSAVTIAVVCKTSDFMVEDGSAATQNILNAATAYGYGSCWVAGYNRPYSKQVLDLLKAPKDYTLISLVPIGIVDCHQQRPQKKDLASVMSYNKFE